MLLCVLRDGLDGVDGLLRHFVQTDEHCRQTKQQRNEGTKENTQESDQRRCILASLVLSRALASPHPLLWSSVPDP